MLRERELLLSVLLLGFGAGIGRADTTINFDSFTPKDTCTSPISTGGLTFTGTGGCLGVWEASPNTPGIGDLIFDGSTVAITADDGGAFNLDGIDMTISWYDSLATDSVMLTADFEGGGSSTQTLSLLQGLHTYGLDLMNVSAVDISGVKSGTGYWAMDSLTSSAAAVPEPAETIPALIGFSLLALYQTRKGRQTKFRAAKGANEI